MLREEVSKRILEQLLDLDTFEHHYEVLGVGEWLHLLHTKSKSDIQNNYDLIWGYTF